MCRVFFLELEPFPNLKKTTQLVHSVFQSPGTDTIWTCSFNLVQSPQLPLHLTASDRLAEGGGRGVSVFPGVRNSVGEVVLKPMTEVCVTSLVK